MAEIPVSDDTASFESALAAIRKIPPSRGVRLLRPLMLLAAPLLGALDDRTKQRLAEATGGEHVFSAEVATASNVLLDFLLYPVLGYCVGLVAGMPPLGESDRGWIMLGIVVASVETMVRLRQGIFRARPVGEIALGGSAYGTPIAWLLRPLISQVARWRRNGVVPVEGFVGEVFESKRERERRYGEVYIVEEHAGGSYVRLELPRNIPASQARDRLQLGDEMPDYDLKVELDDGSLLVRGSVAAPELRAVCGVSPAFPADFLTRIPLRGIADRCVHRYENKLLEVVVVRKGVPTGANGSNRTASG